jgi:mono/diheme cytochrome c family protein
MKNKIIYLGAFCMTALFIASCSTHDKDSPGFEYMPDMYRSTSYETNSGNGNFSDSMTNRQPVKGTISYDQEVTAYHPYPYPNNDSGYAWAGRNLHDPFPATKEILDKGTVLYSKFCVHCHGASGGGDGLVGSKLPGPPPAYSGPLKDLPEGKMFHTLQFGKGLMGSHASQLTPDERWMIIRYVQTLQGKKFDTNGMLLVQVAPADTTKKSMKK